MDRPHKDKNAASSTTSRPKRRGAGQAKAGTKAQRREAAEAAEAAAAAEAALAASLPTPPAARLTIEVGHTTTRYWLRPADARAPAQTGAFVSCVAYRAASGWRAGEAAARGSLFAPEGVLHAPTRLLGQPKDAQVVATAATRPGAARLGEDGDDAAFVLHGRTVRPELATAALLAEVAHRLADAQAEVPDDVVLLVPGHLELAGARALRQAAVLADYPPPRLAYATSGAARLAARALVARGLQGTLCVVDVGASGAHVTVLTVARDEDGASEQDGAGPAALDATLEAAEGNETDAAAAPTDGACDGAVSDRADAPEASADGQLAAAMGAEDVDQEVSADAATDGAGAGAEGEASPTGTDDVTLQAGADAPDGASAEAADADEAQAGETASALALETDAELRLPAPLAARTAGAASSGPTSQPLRLHVVSHRAAQDIGGEAWDADLVAWLRDNYLAAHDTDPAATELGAGRLWSAAERARRALNDAPEVQVNLPHLTADARGTRHLEATLRRDELAAMADDATQRLLSLCRSACRAAGRELREVDGWAAVGAAAQAHHLTQALRRAFHRAPLELHDAVGASVAGAALPEGLNEGPQEACVAALARTLPTGGEEVLVNAGAPLPVTVSFVVPTGVDEQDLLRVPLHLGEASGELAWRPAGWLQVDDLPPSKAGALKVELELTLDPQMHLSAHAHANGRPLPVRHLHASGLSDERLARLAAAQAAEVEGRAMRAQLATLRQDAQAMLNQTAALGAGVLGAEAEDVEQVADEDNALVAAEAERLHGLREALEQALAQLPDEDAQAHRDEDRPPPAPDAEALATLELHVRALRHAAGRAAAAGASASLGA